MIVLAFLAIYILWGTTFLAIRVAVREVPPLFAAGTRMFLAGVILFVFMWMRGATLPTKQQWRSLSLMGSLMFVLDYGLLFWAEKYVPSGIAAVLSGHSPPDDHHLPRWWSFVCSPFAGLWSALCCSASAVWGC